MPFYRKHGIPTGDKYAALQTVISDAEFKEIMDQGKFCRAIHRAYTVLIYYTGVRKTEALRARREQFRLMKRELIFSVGKRLKHGIVTPGLNLPYKYPFMPELVAAIQATPEGKRVFPFSPMTAYYVFDRLGFYPHYFRLNRITHLFLAGWDIETVHSWTGLTLKALDHYMGLVRVSKVGRSLVPT